MQKAKGVPFSFVTASVKASFARIDDKSRSESHLYSAMRYLPCLTRRVEPKERFFPAHCGCTYSSRSSDHAPRVSKPLITHRINLRSEPYRVARYFSWQLIRSLPLPSPRPHYVSRNNRSRLRTINPRRGFARKWIAFFARHYANENIACEAADVIRHEPSPMNSLLLFLYRSWYRSCSVNQRRPIMWCGNKSVSIKRNTFKSTHFFPK